MKTVVRIMALPLFFDTGWLMEIIVHKGILGIVHFL